MQTFWKSVKIWQSYRELKGGNFSEIQCSLGRHSTFVKLATSAHDNRRGEPRVFRVGVTGKAAPSDGWGWGPKGRKRGWRFLGRGNQPPPPRGSGERCELPAGFGAEPQPPSGFSIFWVLWMASPVNRIRCRDVFSSLSFIYFAHYRACRVTNAIPECRGIPLLQEEISHRICANHTSRLLDMWQGFEPPKSCPVASRLNVCRIL